jgi:acyl-CoA synthetase (AMP-forming)/AMP-acid ligase II
MRYEDVIYSYLPCYHASGVQVGIGSALCFGNRTILKKKFSASNFFKDCVKYDVTVSISISCGITSKVQSVA